MSDTLNSLHGLRILVAEDEYMIADEIDGVLTGAGAQVVGPVSRVGEALALAQSPGHLDGAILDVNLANELIWPVVDLLVASNVPVVLATGLDAGNVPARHAGLPRCEKPAEAQVVARALAHCVTATRHFEPPHDT